MADQTHEYDQMLAEAEAALIATSRLIVELLASGLGDPDLRHLMWHALEYTAIAGTNDDRELSAAAMAEANKMLDVFGVAR